MFIVVAGHTGADYATTRAALDAGVCGFTHLYNAMTPLSSRDPGVVGAALDDPYSWCGLIVDGHHVHPATLRVAVAAKARGKCVLVTDAMPPVGSDRPDYVLNGQTIVMRDGICQSEAGVLAGLRARYGRCRAQCGADARLAVGRGRRGWQVLIRQSGIGLGRTHGRIAAGHRADFAVLDDSLTVRETWVGGVAYPIG